MVQSMITFYLTLTESELDFAEKQLRVAMYDKYANIRLYAIDKVREIKKEKS